MNYIILGLFDTLEGCSLYWSNDNGWVDRDSATVFSQLERDTFDLPLEAIGWMKGCERMTTLELVEAYEYAERRQTDHYYYCSDQRDEVGCDTCARNSDEVYAARKAMNASPAAKELYNSEERRAYRRADALASSPYHIHDNDAAYESENS